MPDTEISDALFDVELPPAAPTIVTPLMKWVGGKKRLLPTIVAHYQGQGKVVEPFFGGGAVSFYLASHHRDITVHANEKLGPIVDIYEAVRGDVEAFITDVDQWAVPYLEEDGKADRRAFYYWVRDEYLNFRIDGPAPLFFMLWCAYSGLYRTSREVAGRFNTSHGFGVEKPGFYKPANLRAASELMANWTITNDDFYDTLQVVDADTFVFLDPPYRETYDNYTPDGFSAEDQLRVVEYFKAAAATGAQVVYTNKDTGDDFYDTHFEGFHIDRVPIRYQVNRNCAEVGRPETFEVVITAR